MTGMDAMHIALRALARRLERSGRLLSPDPGVDKVAARIRVGDADVAARLRRRAANEDVPPAAAPAVRPPLPADEAARAQARRDWTLAAATEFKSDRSDLRDIVLDGRRVTLEHRLPDTYVMQSHQGPVVLVSPLTDSDGLRLAEQRQLFSAMARVVTPPRSHPSVDLYAVMNDGQLGRVAAQYQPPALRPLADPLAFARRNPHQAAEAATLARIVQAPLEYEVRPDGTLRIALQHGLDVPAVPHADPFVQLSTQPFMRESVDVAREHLRENVHTGLMSQMVQERTKDTALSMRLSHAIAREAGNVK
ncbi:MAG: hypothetical protein HOQ24_19205 [Mycobacteriaceae bacterium]|nr:hypothetical protein [Mycobacteriaceae bacterium]